MTVQENHCPVCETAIPDHQTFCFECNRKPPEQLAKEYVEQNPPEFEPAPEYDPSGANRQLYRFAIGTVAMSAILMAVFTAQIVIRHPQESTIVILSVATAVVLGNLLVEIAAACEEPPDL